MYEVVRALTFADALDITKQRAAAKGYPEFDDDQPRDEFGRWAATGAGFGAAGTVTREWLAKRFPGARITIEDLGRDGHVVEVFDRGFDFDFDGYKFAFHVNNGEPLHFSNLRVGDGARDKARDAVMAVYDAAMASDAPSIVLEGSKESGGYVWPRMGFDLADVDDFTLLTGIGGELEDKYELAEQLLPGPLFDKVRDIVATNKPDMATRIARLDDPISRDIFDKMVPGQRQVKITPTLGKAILLGTSNEFTLPRARFSVLRDWAKRGVAKAKDKKRKGQRDIADIIFEDMEKREVEKGYPEFDPDQPRDEEGRFSGDGTELTLLQPRVKKGEPEFDPSQARDEGGQWSETGAGGREAAAGKPGSRASDIEFVEDSDRYPRTVEAMRRAIDQVPDEHWRLLEGFIEFEATRDVTGSMGVRTPLEGITIDLEGSSGETWTHIKVGTQVLGRPLDDVQGTTMHEIGHALDTLYNLELSRRLAPIMRNEVAALTPQQRRYVQHYLGDDSELFADLYQLAYSRSGPGKAFGMKRAEAEKAFAKSLKALRALPLESIPNRRRSAPSPTKKSDEFKVPKNAFRVYTDQQGARRLDFISQAGQVYPLKPSEDDKELEDGYYTADAKTKDLRLLRRLTEEAEAEFGKGYPEFNPDQPRDEEGRFSGGNASRVPNDDDEVTPEFIAALPKEIRTEKDAQQTFKRKLLEMARAGEVVLYHETPGDQKQLIERKGLVSDWTVFATIGQNSNFVTSDVKAITTFTIPSITDLNADQRYGWSAKLGAHQLLLLEHPNVKGADVSTTHERIPRTWIKKVEVVRVAAKSFVKEFGVTVLDKGYPEYDPTQARNEAGQWSRGGGRSAVGGGRADKQGRDRLKKLWANVKPKMTPKQREKLNKQAIELLRDMGKANVASRSAEMWTGKPGSIVFSDKVMNEVRQLSYLLRTWGDPKRITTDLLAAKTNQTIFNGIFEHVKSLPKDRVIDIANDYLNRPTSGTHRFKFPTKDKALKAIRGMFVERAQEESKRKIIDRMTGGRARKGYPEFDPDQPRGEGGRWASQAGSWSTIGTPRYHVEGAGAAAKGINAALKRIPDNHRKFLKGHGVKFYAVPYIPRDAKVHGGLEDDEGLLGVMYDYNNKVVIANGVKFTIKGKEVVYAVWDAVGTALHETGHAIDNISDHQLSTMFAPLILYDAKGMMRKERINAEHLLSNRYEGFAELYRLTYMKPAKSLELWGGMTHERAAKVFAHSIKSLKKVKLRVRR